MRWSLDGRRRFKGRQTYGLYFGPETSGLVWASQRWFALGFPATKTWRLGRYITHNTRTTKRKRLWQMAWRNRHELKFNQKDSWNFHFICNYFVWLKRSKQVRMLRIQQELVLLSKNPNFNTTIQILVFKLMFQIDNDCFGLPNWFWLRYNLFWLRYEF